MTTYVKTKLYFTDANSLLINSNVFLSHESVRWFLHLQYVPTLYVYKKALLSEGKPRDVFWDHWKSRRGTAFPP